MPRRCPETNSAKTLYLLASSLLQSLICRLKIPVFCWCFVRVLFRFLLPLCPGNAQKLIRFWSHYFVTLLGVFCEALWRLLNRFPPTPYLTASSRLLLRSSWVKYPISSLFILCSFQPLSNRFTVIKTTSKHHQNCLHFACVLIASKNTHEKIAGVYVWDMVGLRQPISKTAHPPGG